MRNLKLAVIDGGAMARNVHLPISALCEHVGLAYLVDASLPRGRQLADKYDVSSVVDDYRKIIGEADAAIVVLPHDLRAPVTLDLLRNNSCAVRKNDSFLSGPENQLPHLTIGYIS